MSAYISMWLFLSSTGICSELSESASVNLLTGGYAHTSGSRTVHQGAGVTHRGLFYLVSSRGLSAQRLNIAPRVIHSPTSCFKECVWWDSHNCCWVCATIFRTVGSGWNMKAMFDVSHNEKEKKKMQRLSKKKWYKGTWQQWINWPWLAIN